MEPNMTIGIIGAGNIGQAIAKRLSSAHIPASISNSRGASSLSSIVQALGAGITAAERRDAAKADMVFLAVPWSAHSEGVANLAPWNHRIVIDAMNAASFGPGGLSAVACCSSQEMMRRPSEKCRFSSIGSDLLPSTLETLR
jgi:predicted dinucleotide-binding enzyme